jgi:hypothetical protein
MRYYAIKISGATSPSTPANQSGSASITTNSPNPTSGSSKRKFKPIVSDYDPFAGGSVSNANQDPRQEWAQSPSGQNPANPTDYQTVQIPSSIQPTQSSGTTPGTGTGTNTGTTGTGASGAQFCSVVNGQNDPGALDVEFEIEVVKDQPSNNNHIKIKGVTPQMISQASNFNKCRLQLWAGYSPGLPLANLQVPHQGLIMDGMIWPAFGNWIYNELTLEFYVILNVEGLGGPTQPKNIVHNMPAGQPLSTAIQNTLKIAFPNSTINVNISSALKLNYPDWGIYQSLEQFGNYIKALSHSILGVPPKYNGVEISTNGNNINVHDGTNPPNTIQIQYEDLIGQPTWVENNTILVKTCLRGDIPFPQPSIIQLPDTLITQTAQGAVSRYGGAAGINYSGSGTNLLFSGTWSVTGVRHIGKFRDPGMDAWVTLIKAVTTQASTNTNTLPTSTPSPAPGGAANQSGQQPFESGFPEPEPEPAPSIFPGDTAPGPG